MPPIYVVEKSDIYDALGQPYYYIGAENPPNEFKNKWGHFLVYALGFDKKRDTYLTKWQESNGFGNWNGDYIVYSDKRNYCEIKNSANKDGRGRGQSPLYVQIISDILRILQFF